MFCKEIYTKSIENCGNIWIQGTHRHKSNENLHPCLAPFSQSRPQSEFVALPLLYRYTRPFGDLIGCNSVLRGNSILRGVIGYGMSKFDGKPHSLRISAINCYLSLKFGQ